VQEDWNLIQREAFFSQRLQPLRRVCAALAGGVLIMLMVAWFLLGPGGFVPPRLPDAVPLSITAASAILILASSRLRSSIVRRSFPTEPSLQPRPENVLAAYQKGTLVSFALLDGAAVLGLLVALLSGSRLYGTVLCAAALLGMLTRWPRASEIDRLLRGRASL
jgi:hypothetical protein